MKGRDDVTQFTNFGANVTFSPAQVLRPGSPAELLNQLSSAGPGRRIRVVGRLHSWSGCMATDDLLVDLQQLKDIQLDPAANPEWVDVSAGCQIKEVIAFLDARGLTLPALGLIDEQTLAGAAATGTHGSGRESLSHFVLSARVARRDPATDAWEVIDVADGPELRALRCHLGCLGIVVSLRLPVRTQYRIEEHFRLHSRLEDIFSEEAEYPLQQFFFLPWRWDYFAQHRCEVEQPRSPLAGLYRAYWFAFMDIGLHLIVTLLARWIRNRSLTYWFFRWPLPKLVIPNWKVVDVSHRQLTMQHELFRHIEIETFVRASQLPEYLRWVRELLEYCSVGGGSDDFLGRAAAAGCGAELEAARGQYTHHYPICIRKVLPDDTLISPGAGDSHSLAIGETSERGPGGAFESRYAVSFISYDVPAQRDGFDAFAALLAKFGARRFDARPHWGKYCPLTSDDLAPLYPQLQQFKRLCAAADPLGEFQTDWSRVRLTGA